MALMHQASRLVYHKKMTVPRFYPGCVQPNIFSYEVEFVKDYHQFGHHDCGLFILKIMEHWDGRCMPEILGASELRLRKKVLFEWLRRKENAADWKQVHLRSRARGGGSSSTAKENAE